ncbi:MAG: DUF367 family protein [Promethearchaeota archaeon]
MLIDENKKNFDFQLKLHVLHLNQCDPKKCTSKKLKKHSLVRLHKRFKTIPPRSIKLDPFAKRELKSSDRIIIERFGLTVIDCSWKKAVEVLNSMKVINGRKLPAGFMAGNPINYAIEGKLSSVEALAAALVVTGFHEHAKFLLSKFHWGHTFWELNKNLIESYVTGEYTR